MTQDVVDTEQNPVFIHRGVHFTPSSYDADITANNTAQGGALATGVKLGGGMLYVYNKGTGNVRLTFGTSQTNADDNLNIAANAATTGILIPAGVWIPPISVPYLSTNYSTLNDVAEETPVFEVNQGV